MASVIDTERFRGKVAASQGSGGDGGGGVDDILRRLGVVEAGVVAVSGDVRDIKSILPTLATRVELEAVRGDVREIKAVVATLATKAELEALRGDVGKMKERMSHFATKAEISEIHAGMIKWAVVTIVTCNAAAISIAKFVG